jgi:hypothetical protein
VNEALTLLLTDPTITEEEALVELGSGGCARNRTSGPRPAAEKTANPRVFDGSTDGVTNHLAADIGPPRKPRPLNPKG